MAARPPYGAAHSGPVLLCGPAPTLYADFKAARAHYPDAALIAISWAIRAIRAPHLVTQHYEKAAEMRVLAAKDWPGHALTIHSQPVRQRWDEGRAFDVDHVWDEAAHCMNSAAAAATIAFAMGFDQAIFCGVALDGTEGYAFDTGTGCFWQGEEGQRYGAVARAELLHKFGAAYRGRIFAMSGGPKILFGLPPRVGGAA